MGRIGPSLLGDLRYRIRRWHAWLYTKYWGDVYFVHINKTAGSSIEQALGLPFQHRTAQELRELVGQKRWEKGFSFAFVRNPWDKVASHYHFRVQTNQTRLAEDPIDFNEWVVRAYGEHDPRYYDQPKMFMPQVQWIDDEDGKRLVDFVGRFERLEEDFARICRLLGTKADLPHLKPSSRPHYRELYDDIAAKVVRSRFQRDLDRFRYSY